MDQDATLDKILDLTEEMNELQPYDDVSAEHFQELAEAIKDLDYWLSRGGALPERWNLGRMELP